MSDPRRRLARLATPQEALRRAAPHDPRELDACGIGFVADAQGRSSRAIVAAALGGLACVKHRGAVAADARTADGSGLLVPIPPALFGEGNGVAVLFVRGDDPRPAVEAALAAEGLRLVDWREPPLDPAALGELARATAPRIVQPCSRRRGGRTDSEAERRALRLRRRIEATTEGTYVASCSFRTIVYKGLAAADALADFYLDLHDERFAAPFAVFHQRFSTNTLPTWERAQPFRMLCHNGEINAIEGNENRMRAGPARHRGGRPRRRGACSARCSTPTTPTRASSTPPSSCWCGRARPPPRRWPCSCPRRGRTCATSTPRCAASTATTRP